MYPRPSPYIESNLHKFATGPSTTLLPVHNEMPVHSKTASLSSDLYYSRADYQRKDTCFCCL